MKWTVLFNSGFPSLICYKVKLNFQDAKSGKEIKELKSRITQLQDQLQTCKSQLKLNEEYHNKITTNLEKSGEDLKIQHKQELAQIELSHRTQLLELEHQIQKQRERTLSLLEEKDKEIALLKSSFLTPFVKKVSKNQVCEYFGNIYMFKDFVSLIDTFICIIILKSKYLCI